MNVLFRRLWIIPLLASFTACGGREQSPQTRRYLQQVTAGLDQLNRALSRQAVPAAPALPELSKAADAADARELDRFSVRLSGYYSAAEKTADQVMAICDQVQSKTVGLDTTNVDAAAGDLGDRYVGLTDRRRQLALDFAAFVSAQRSSLADGRVSRYAPKLAAVGLATLLSPTSAAGRGDRFEPSADERSEMDPQALSVEQAIAHWRSDAASISLARKGLLSSLKARYPGSDWSFLAGK